MEAAFGHRPELFFAHRRPGSALPNPGRPGKPRLRLPAQPRSVSGHQCSDQRHSNFPPPPFPILLQHWTGFLMPRRLLIPVILPLIAALAATTTRAQANLHSARSVAAGAESGQTVDGIAARIEADILTESE